MEVRLSQVFIFNSVHAQQSIVLLKANFWESHSDIITEFVLRKISN